MIFKFFIFFFLQTLSQISAEKNSTIVFPLPIDLITYFLKSNDAATQQLAEAAVAAMDKIATKQDNETTTISLEKAS